MTENRVGPPAEREFGDPQGAPLPSRDGEQRRAGFAGSEPDAVRGTALPGRETVAADQGDLAGGR